MEQPNKGLLKPLSKVGASLVEGKSETPKASKKASTFLPNECRTFRLSINLSAEQKKALDIIPWGGKNRIFLIIIDALIKKMSLDGAQSVMAWLLAGTLSQDELNSLICGMQEERRGQKNEP